MPTIQLIKPCESFEQSYRDYIEELGDEERYPFPLDFEHDDFPALLKKLTRFEQGIDLPEGFVPSTTYWLVEGKELLGVSNLRHHLNEKIRHVGGHIGLGIRPSMRRKGLSEVLLQKTIERGRIMGIEDVHIHCHKHNQPSVRMIEACGGKLESEVFEGEAILRFVVPFSDQY